MGALAVDTEYLDYLIRDKGLSDQFSDKAVAHADCPNVQCGARKAARLNRASGKVSCTQCGLDGSLIDYLTGLDRAEEVLGDNIYAIHAEREAIETVKQIKTPAEQSQQDAQARIEAAQKAQRLAREAERAEENRRAAKEARRGKLGERLIITVLALIFLGAGLAAAALSGFANFQAFSASVGDPIQGQVWGWSGVIASVCSFGGFTFFWWHTSAGRIKEGVRALVFALAGAATSIAGTAMFMDNNTIEQQSAALQVERTRGVIEAQIADWGRQLEGIPASTRTVAGLEAYLAGVEAAGRTHQKPYRDAQNELGLAQRRVVLETHIAEARAQLLGSDAEINTVAAPEKKSLPAWFFALMLEVFSSQGTSIAFVSLLLLYGAGARTSSERRSGSGSLSPADPAPA